MNPFKVLLVYPNPTLLNPPPVSIGTFNALLRQQGYDVELFDTTFYREDISSDESKQEMLQVRPFNFDPERIPTQDNPPSEDLARQIERFRPDLICLSVLESTWIMGSNLLDAIHSVSKAPVLVGGIFATFAPEIVIKHPAVTMVCVGEGEGPLLDICSQLQKGESCENISNLVVKRADGTIVRNPLRPVVDINAIPIPDYAIFHPGRFLRPMAGRVYRTVPIETNRGCPYKCAFCNSPSTARMHREMGAGTFFRKKTLGRIQTELRELINRWDAEYVYFPSDTFLVMSPKEFDEFIDIYSEFKLPFWIQSRAETITLERAQKLKDVGCHRMSIGLEQGNEEFRQNRLQKRYRNEQIIKAGKILHEVGIPLSLNNIIGFPDETRDLIFDTIELNRQIPWDTTNAYAFTPFHGTPLHTYCVEKGWIEPDFVFGCTTIDAPLDMPQLSRQEIIGLRKTFTLYARLPKDTWPMIRIAEQDTPEGLEMFEKLKNIYTESYFNEE